MPQHRPVIIGLIHAKWCGHCVRLMPIWEQMKSNIAANGGYHPPPEFKDIEHANLGELDDFNRENAVYLKHQQIKPNGFPTIFKIKNGNIEYYPGDKSRDATTMEKWFMGDRPLRSASSHRRRRHSRYRSRGGGKASRRRRRTIKIFHR